MMQTGVRVNISTVITTTEWWRCCVLRVADRDEGGRQH